MLNLLDVAQRAWSGPRMEEKEWRMRLFHKVQELVQRYHIQAPDPADRTQSICRDTALIDAAITTEMVLNHQIYTDSFLKAERIT